MDIISIISRVIPYAIIAIIVAFISIGGIFFGYKRYKRRGGKHTITKIQFAAFFLLVAWFIVVIGITMFSRGSNFQGWFNFRLFSGYINAWNNWSLSELQLIIFNMLMFLPLGFLLPLLGNRLQRFIPVFLASLIVTVMIEIVQMLTGRGVLELDDILHNTIGSISGYLLISAILFYVEQKQFSFKLILRALAIPLIFAMIFLGATIVYNRKELGNLPILPAIPQDTSKGKIQLNIALAETEETVSIYHNDQIHNLAYGEKVLSMVKEQFMLEQIGGRRIDGSNRVYALRDSSGFDYYFTFFLSDGGWTLTKNEFSEEIPTQETLQNRRQIIETWLIEGELMPSDAEFSIQDKDTLRWSKEIPNDINLRNNNYASGIIMVQVSVDSMVPQEIFSTMVDNSYVRTVDIISPKDAFEQVKKGNFQQYNDLKNDFLLSVESYSLTYVYDTKGYYRPAYLFEGTLDGESWSCLIPAM